MQTEHFLETLFQTGVAAVRGDAAVAKALEQTPIQTPHQIIAVGKAATAMALAAHARFPDTPLLIVTKYDHADGAPASAEVIEAAHPVLDDNSLRAGARIGEIVRTMGKGGHLLLLVSGGASALAEDPSGGLNLAGLKARAEQLLASGADIHAMNSARKQMSRIKGGKLLARFKGAQVTTLAISDVEGDSLAVIGSGIGDVATEAPFAFSPQIVASNAIARAAVADACKTQGVPVQTNDETLYDDIHALAPRLGAILRDGAPGVHVFGGEPTVVLPENPGRGGRNQALALLLAREIAGCGDIRTLVAGTDGTDGPTDAAGAVVDGQIWDASGEEALARADAGTWLAARGALLKTGPTGTNVMDLVIALKY
ncbi:glycerate kinase type-2 family protein [Roseobacter sp. EG26]|uniref:glycerate kinase type-2 family protein n=1 Tax=Roseobacter sp. EG26 TaxID=3412477 RepID=UPI003CE5B100